MSRGPSSQNVDHECIGGRKVSNCPMCAGNPPRKHICRDCKGWGFKTLPCTYCCPAETTADGSSSSLSNKNMPDSSVRSSLGSAEGPGRQ
ncbi:hypothetical protein VTN77DRAFT_8355 [Rasamsonia byssochlamydoides]|uniref:uncharacterized protein n=1 Tax=Rasamsonia byssochlamydoides TaxID=89139 RepID=UPI0037427F48